MRWIILLVLLRCQSVLIRLSLSLLLLLLGTLALYSPFLLFIPIYLFELIIHNSFCLRLPTSQTQVQSIAYGVLL